MEMTVAVGIVGILVLVLASFVGRSFQISREHFEQVRITEDARIQMERLSDTIRNARYLDCNSDGDVSDVGENWLQAATDYEMIIYTNVDNDTDAERVRYFVDTTIEDEVTHLQRGVTEPGVATCDFSGAERVTTVMETLRNATEAQPIPLFTYFANRDDSSQLGLPVTLTNVARVRMQLIVDQSAVQHPSAADLYTDVAIRAYGCNEGECGGSACIVLDTANGTYPYAGDFADEAFADCKDYCATNGSLPADECCGWSVGFDYIFPGTQQGGTDLNPENLVWAACQCQSATIPDGLTPTTLSPGNYSDYVRECLDGTTCGNDSSGNPISGDPICDAGCLQTPGECACFCG